MNFFKWAVSRFIIFLLLQTQHCPLHQPQHEQPVWTLVSLMVLVIASFSQISRNGPHQIADWKGSIRRAKAGTRCRNILAGWMQLDGIRCTPLTSCRSHMQTTFAVCCTLLSPCPHRTFVCQCIPAHVYIHVDGGSPEVHT